MAKANNISKEDIEFLNSRKKSNTPKEEETKKDDVVYSKSISVNKDGEFTGFGRELIIRPLDTYAKWMRRGTKRNNFKPVIESVMVKTGTKGKPFIDTAGTIMCGRLPKYLTESMNDTQKKENDKRATLYIVLYGLLESGELARVSLPNVKGSIVQNFLQKLEVDDIASTTIKIVFDEEDKIQVEVVKEGQDVAPLISEFKRVAAEVEKYNNYIESRHKKVKVANIIAKEVLDGEIPF